MRMMGLRLITTTNTIDAGVMLAVPCPVSPSRRMGIFVFSDMNSNTSSTCVQVASLLSRTPIAAEMDRPLPQIPWNPVELAHKRSRLYEVMPYHTSFLNNLGAETTVSLHNKGQILSLQHLLQSRGRSWGAMKICQHNLMKLVHSTPMAAGAAWYLLPQHVRTRILLSARF